MIGLETLAFTPFDPWHLLVLGLVALLLFGKRLPEVGRSLGKGIAEFKKGLHEVQNELNKEEPKPEPPRQLRPPPEDEYAAARKFLAGDEPRPARPQAPTGEPTGAPPPPVGPVPGEPQAPTGEPTEKR
jgi:sec-independent protein translocase protein TatA